MNRRDFFRGLLATTAIIPTVSTKTIVDLAANTWRNNPPGWLPPEASWDFASLVPHHIDSSLLLNPIALWCMISRDVLARKLKAP